MSGPAQIRGELDNAFGLLAEHNLIDRRQEIGEGRTAGSLVCGGRGQACRHGMKR